MASRSGTYGAASHRGGESLPAARAEAAAVQRATRSDEDIQRDIRDRLNGEPQLAFAAIEIEAAQGAVTLNGSVSDRWCLKQAERLVRRTRGVTSVRNALRIELHGTGTTGDARPPDSR